MKELSDKELTYRLSLYVDGMLDEAGVAELEAYLASHPDARTELAELRRLKNMLAEKKRVDSDPFFATRLLARIREKQVEEENLLPFQRKYIPLVAALGIIASVGIGVTLFLQRGPLMEYLSEKSQAVQEAYESNILKGTIMPLFANIDNDKVLQFALFGTLPLDETEETTLRVDEASEQGYRIEVGVTAEQRPPAVTVKDLYSQVQPTKTQELLIDSLLEQARVQIEKGAFYAENNALAIDPHLTQLNRAVLSNIAAVLAPAQRLRFDKFLSHKNATYALAPEAPPSPVEPEVAMKRLPPVRTTEQYFVITSDSVAIVHLNLNIDSLIRAVDVEMPAVIPRAEVSARLARLMRSRFEHGIGVRAPRTERKMPLRTVNEEDFFKIEFGHQMFGGAAESIRVWVKPRMQTTKVFRFENRSGGGTVRVYGMPEIEVQIGLEEIDSMMRRLDQSRYEHQKELQKLDSLWRARTKRPWRPDHTVITDSAGTP